MESFPGNERLEWESVPPSKSTQTTSRSSDEELACENNSMDCECGLFGRKESSALVTLVVLRDERVGWHMRGKGDSLLENSLHHVSVDGVTGTQ